MIEAIFGRTSQIVQKGMELRMLRQSMLASNIANAEVPNYRAVDIDFRATMENLIAQTEQANSTRHSERPFELERSDPRHFSLSALQQPDASEARIVFAAGDTHSVGNDNNTVSLEEQLARMQMNTLHHAALSQLLGKQIAGIKNLIEASSRT